MAKLQKSKQYGHGYEYEAIKSLRKKNLIIRALELLLITSVLCYIVNEYILQVVGVRITVYCYM